MTTPDAAVRRSPTFDLDPPATYLFTVDDARRGRAINRFASSLRDPDRRRAFADDEAGVLAASGLPHDVVEMIRQRDWTGLMRAGAHLQVLLFVAAPLGQTLWDLGAHNVGCARDELIAACPRRVSGLPGPMVGAAWQS